MNRKSIAGGGVLISCLLAVFSLAFAQSDCCPGKCCMSPIVVPFPPGGPADVFGRQIAKALSERWGREVVVENKGGGGGMIGAKMVAESSPSNPQILVATSGMVATSSIFPKAEIDFSKDLKPAVLVAEFPLVLVASAQSGLKTLEQVLDFAKKNPGKLMIGSGGNGSIAHLASELLSQKAGARFIHVPYRGIGPALTDFYGGQINLLFLDPPSAERLAKEGKGYAIAVASTKRLPLLPEVRTLAEQGIKDADFPNWLGLMLPRSASPQAAQRLHDDVTQALSPEVRKRLEEGGYRVTLQDPGKFAQALTSQSVLFARIVKESNIKLD